MKSIKINVPRTRVALMAALSLGWASQLQAQLMTDMNYAWKGGDTQDANDWFRAGNWVQGEVPKGLDQFPDWGMVCPMFCSPPRVSIDDAGHMAVISGAAATDIMRLMVGDKNDSALLLRDGGTLVLTGEMFTWSAVGALQGATGTVTVTGAESLLSAKEIRIGHQGSGILNLLDGGVLRMGDGIGTLDVAFEAGSSGLINIGAAQGQAAASAGVLEAGTVAFGAGAGRVVFNHDSAGYVFGAALAGAGTVDLLQGTTLLTGQSTMFSGTATVASSGDAHATRLVANNVTLGDGNAHVVVTNGFLSTGLGNARAASILTIGGDLTLGSGAVVEMALGTPSAVPDGFGMGDRIDVTGNLALGGRFDLASLNGGLDYGRYELFHFGGTLSGINSVALNIAGGLTGALEEGELTGGGGRVILNIQQALGLDAYWAGTDGDGGHGIWDNSTANWGDAGGNFRDVWNGSNAIFTGSGGDVSVTESVVFSSLNVDNGDYRIAGADAAAELVATAAEGQTNVILNAFDGAVGRIDAVLRGAAADTRLRKQGEGTIILSNNANSWSGPITVSAGRLQIDDGSGSGNGPLPGNVDLQSAGTLAFNRSQYTYGGVIGGNGQVRQIGAGTTTLTGNNTYGGLTTIESGVLQIGNGGATGNLGSGGVAIASGATLAFNRSGDLEILNAMTGAGDIAQRGGGVLTLSGLSAFTGQLLAQSGSVRVAGAFGGSAQVSTVLTVNGTMAGLVDVLDGGTLKGSGSVGSARIRNGALLASGNSIGTLAVAGNLGFDAGSAWEIEVDRDGNTDRVDVGGNLRIDGGTVKVLAGGDADARLWRPYNRYTVLTYLGDLEGDKAFAGVESNFAFLTPELEYGLGAITLRLDRNDIAFADIGHTPNQSAAGAALQSLGFEHPVAAANIPLYDGVLGLTAEDARAAFDSMSGEVHASLAAMLLDDSRLIRKTVMDRAFLFAGGGADMQLWGQALSHRGSAGGNGVSDFERNALGLVIGRDYALNDGAFSLGWAVGHHLNDSATVAQLNSQGTAKNTHVAVYGGTRRASGLGVRLGLGHSWHEVDVKRTVAFAGFSPEDVKTGYEGTTLQGFGEADYLLRQGALEIVPFLGLAWARLQTDGFMEADFSSPIGSTVALRADAHRHDASFATLGARGAWALGPASQLRGALGYRRALSGEAPSLRVGFVDGGQRFDVLGAPIARDAAMADLGIDVGLSDTVRLGASYSGQLAGDVRDHAIEARLVWTLE